MRIHTLPVACRVDILVYIRRQTIILTASKRLHLPFQVQSYSGQVAAQLEKPVI